MLGLIENFLSDFIKEGALEFAFANGKVVRFGDRGVADPPRVALRDRKAEWELLRRPELAFGELYMNGRADVVHGTLDEVLGTVSRNAMRNDAPAWLRLLFKTRIALRALHQRNDPNRPRSFRFSQMKKALPTIFSSGTNPQTRLSLELSRLSPIMK